MTQFIIYAVKAIGSILVFLSVDDIQHGRWDKNAWGFCMFIILAIWII